MNTGKDIKSLHDIQIMITYLCTTKKSFSKDDIFVLAKKSMEGSRLIVNKLLKTLISQAVDFLIKHDLLTENNGIYYQIGCLPEITNIEVETL